VRKYFLLFVGLVSFHVIGTWSLPLIDRDEPRFAEASREMRERRDWVVPFFNGHYRFDKPPLTYWAQVGSYNIFGENDFAARFPSAIAAALTSLAIFAWGSRIATERSGWWAAVVFALSLQTFVHAKAAVADMWLVLFVTTAHWSGWELLHESKRRTPNAQRPTPNCWWLTFYLSLAFGFLAKGPIAFTPLLTLAVIRFAVPDLQLASRFKFGFGILLTLGIVALWGVPALTQTHGDFFRVGIGRHVVARSFGAMEGHGLRGLLGYVALLPFYCVTIFVSFFPWSIKLPSIAKQLWRNRDELDNYLVAGAAIIYVIFSLVTTKLPHYTLPAFPLLALLFARHISRQSFVTTTAGIVAVMYLLIAFIVPPLAARSFPAAELYRQSRDFLKPEMQFGAVDFQEPSLVWYFRSRVNGWMTPLRPGNVSKFMDQTGLRFVVLPTARVDASLPNRPATWKSFSTHGVNIARGKQVDLTLVLKPE
jgi:4-amino-4-deoxy-L-arabinose transferase-like glycosyltransferase